MVSIEMITSQETTVRKQTSAGQYKEFTVLVWNGTIANLTLMALGSSAPEILLSVIEITTSGFYAGELGPSTIVGSAAFNLLVISAVCVIAIPEGEGRLIQDRSVFAITATFSVLAYIWLLVILMMNTPNVVDVWEGVATFILFPFLVWLAYLADQGACSCVAAKPENVGGRVVAINKAGKEVDMDAVMDAAAEGMTEEEQAEKLAAVLGKPKTRAFYRVQATRAGTAGQTAEGLKQKQLEMAGAMATVEFAKQMLVPKSYERFVELKVLRSVNSAIACSVGYRAVGQATESKGEGLLHFAAYQVEATLRLPLMLDEAAFYVVLVDPSPGCEVGGTWSCAVLVEKDESPGMLKFHRERLSVKESQGQVMVKILRVGGACGKVKCRLKTKDGTAIAPKDYQARDELVQLQDGQTELSLPITIMDDDVYEADETFQVILCEPEGGVTFDPTTDGGADKAVATVTIISDEAVRRKVDELAAIVAFNADDVAMSANTWKEQFFDAFEYEGSGGMVDGLMYLLALPWKVGFAFTPPPRMMGGWFCFFVTLAFIGLLTALIGDLAAHMGCCMGLTPAITAITFVALGTSLPDTFASQTAAKNEPYADAAIGNITGSNAVNVFLGLGLPWMIAAFYWNYGVGPTTEMAWRKRYSGADWYVEGMPIGFVVEAADLGFSVVVFTVCALICLACLVMRRACLGYELGGPTFWKVASAGFFVFLWFVYIAMSVLYSVGAFGR